MKILFAGTRGYIDAQTKRHKHHTATIIIHKNKHILIDCGLDWLDKINRLKPDAILLTHAHPDHAWGLQNGAPCPVYATKESWHIINDYPLHDRHVVIPRKRFRLFGVTIQAFAVQHSILAPAVGYRISCGKKAIFVAGDLVFIHEQKEALHNIALYIGDGASIIHPRVRRKGKILFGHSPISTQLTWCKKNKVPTAYFTHCGTQVVTGNTRMINKIVRDLGTKRNVDAHVSYDGLEIEV
jgi:glyoxylase-like metal-dependent hydrolase (beta-lactamase superfamily II)